MSFFSTIFVSDCGCPNIHGNYDKLQRWMGALQGEATPQFLFFVSFPNGGNFSIQSESFGCINAL